MSVAERYNLTEILRSGVPVNWEKLNGADVICKKAGRDIEIRVIPKMSDALALKHAQGKTYDANYRTPRAWFKHLEQGDILDDLVHNICLDAWEGKDGWELLIEENIISHVLATELPPGQCFSGEAYCCEYVKYGIIIEYRKGERTALDLMENKAYKPEQVKVTHLYGVGNFAGIPAPKNF